MWNIIQNHLLFLHARHHFNYHTLVVSDVCDVKKGVVKIYKWKWGRKLFFFCFWIYVKHSHAVMMEGIYFFTCIWAWSFKILGQWNVHWTKSHVCHNNFLGYTIAIFSFCLWLTCHISSKHEQTCYFGSNYYWKNQTLINFILFIVR